MSWLSEHEKSLRFRDVARSCDRSCHRSRPNGAASRIQLRSCCRCGKTDGHGPVFSGDNLAAGYASHRNDVCGHSLLVVLATGITGVVGGTLIKIIEGVFFQNAAKAEIEQLFGHLELIAPALGVAGVLILIAGFAERRAALRASPGGSGLGLKQAGWIGAVQGLCLPFRGFSRSGATISAGVLAGVSKARSEEFSFALAVVLTPPAIIREVLRLIEAQRMSGSAGLGTAILPCLVGGLCAFLAGLLALKWLSRWLQTGRWHLFGIYCLIAAAAVAILHRSGY